VESFNCIHHCSFGCDVQNVHNRIHGTEGVLMVQKVFGEFRLVVSIFVVAKVLAESDGERPIRLSDITLSCTRDTLICRFPIFRICAVGCGCVWRVVC
jgi:hypothetical protein